MRRRSASRILSSLLWLAYLSADSLAIFVLGHLALHANGPQHQLMFFWAPFVLFHLGGQDTLTAFSMEDNSLWLRHLLGLVTQVAAAGYVVSRISWPDRRLLAAMVLMFLSGCFKLLNMSNVNVIGLNRILLRYKVIKAKPQYPVVENATCKN
ncbi:hypothetical protein QYE76_056079 [Lolium multiflorum]|uniref:DUF4220 domain-containing protein n=1 Tax=Lolium multiflorum TaxID=4521 RepID=A0AAD8T2B0_LOLMU|nr:hypothetical protein QYE76_056079 [Lolium multiflorum]